MMVNFVYGVDNTYFEGFVTEKKSFNKKDNKSFCEKWLENFLKQAEEIFEKKDKKQSERYLLKGEKPVEKLLKGIFEIHEKEKNEFQEKISKIPEGKTFTLAEYLDYTLGENINRKCKNYRANAQEFLVSIGYSPKIFSIIAFEKAISLKKISYKNIAESIPDISGLTNETIIKMIKKDFDVWLNFRPDVKKYCPNANLRQLLVYFRNKVNEAQKN